MRTFETGATRDTNDTKADYFGFLSWRAIKRFGAYMLKHQTQADGQKRSSSNWKKGMPIPAYVESLVRHTVDLADAYEQGRMEEADELACAVWFNVQGFIHERACEEGREYRTYNDYCEYTSPVTAAPDALDRCIYRHPGTDIQCVFDDGHEGKHRCTTTS